jgi:hypothetical protein
MPPLPNSFEHAKARAPRTSNRRVRALEAAQTALDYLIDQAQDKLGPRGERLVYEMADIRLLDIRIATALQIRDQCRRRYRQSDGARLVWRRKSSTLTLTSIASPLEALAAERA